MQIEYTPIVQQQKDNPYWKLRTRDQLMLEKALQDRLLFLCELGASNQELDVEVYKLLANTKLKKEFGSASHFKHQPNTGLAALAGAIKKLRTGDLSKKQISYISPTIEVLAKAYPHQFANITFVEKGTANVPVNIADIFAVIEK